MEQVKTIIKKVKRLALTTNKKVEGIIAGNYHSVFRGRGIEFSEIRRYMPGDDIRTLDWKVTARMDEPYCKTFIEERNLQLYLVFDISASNSFGSEKEKKMIGYEIAASFMFAALRNNDAVGLCLFTDHIERFIPASKGKTFVLRLLRELITYQPTSKKTNLAKSLMVLGKVLKKRSILILISDFLDEHYEKPLRYLRKKHDVIALQIKDTYEEALPSLGYVFIEDQETGEQMLINTADKEWQHYYHQLQQQQQQELNKLMKKLKIDFLSLTTTADPYQSLYQLFKMRKKKMRYAP